MSAADSIFARLSALARADRASVLRYLYAAAWVTEWLDGESLDHRTGSLALACSWSHWFRHQAAFERSGALVVSDVDAFCRRPDVRDVVTSTGWEIAPSLLGALPVVYVPAPVVAPV